VVIPRAPQPKAAISGTVSSVEKNEPISAATVTISRHFGSVIERLLEEDNEHLPNIAPVLTDERGRFSFPSIDAGDYDVVVESKGYLRGQTAIVMNAGQSANNVVVRMARGGTINGHVRDK